MRVIAGSLGGRTIASPKGNRTHPMSDKMRGGLFNTLGDINGLTVLDAYAGSGALGIEALSRGAKSVVAIDADKSAHRAITENVQALNLTNHKATKAFISSWSNKNSEQQFDIVLADPPYKDVVDKDLNKLVGHLKNSGTLVLSWPGKDKAPQLERLELVRSNNYGDSQLVFYQKIS